MEDRAQEGFTWLHGTLGRPAGNHLPLQSLMPHVPSQAWGQFCPSISLGGAFPVDQQVVMESWSRQCWEEPWGGSMGRLLAFQIWTPMSPGKQDSQQYGQDWNPELWLTSLCSFQEALLQPKDLSVL